MPHGICLHTTAGHLEAAGAEEELRGAWPNNLGTFAHLRCLHVAEGHECADFLLRGSLQSFARIRQRRHLHSMAQHSKVAAYPAAIPQHIC